jgi:hypothetical protein
MKWNRGMQTGRFQPPSNEDLFRSFFYDIEDNVRRFATVHMYGAEVLAMPRRFMMLSGKSRIMLLIIAGAAISCAAASPPGNAGKPEVMDPANMYCEMIVCVGALKDECEMKIGVMKNYDAPVQREGGATVIKIAEAISVAYVKDWMLQDSLSLDRFKSGDTLLYRNYKEANPDYYARYQSSLLKVKRAIRLDEQAPGYKFTFRQLFASARALVRKNKTQLGAETLLVKRRSYSKRPSNPFFTSPINPTDMY